MKLKQVLITIQIVTILILTGCSSNPEGPIIDEYEPEIIPEKPDDSRLYKFFVQDIDSIPIEDVLVTIETVDSNYVDSTNREGIAYIIIPNEKALPNKVTAILNHATIMSEPVLLPGNRDTDFDIETTTRINIEGEALEEPSLHHLGDGIYSGSANSQLQIPSEGSEISFQFYLLEVSPHGPNIRLYAKGVQYPAKIFFNNFQVAALNPSPSNGDYLEYDFKSPFIVSSYLQLGLNTFTIRAADSPSTDLYDDFEFCCLIIY